MQWKVLFSKNGSNAFFDVFVDVVDEPTILLCFKFSSILSQAMRQQLKFASLVVLYYLD